jgi:hypothetical protein
MPDSTMITIGILAGLLVAWIIYRIGYLTGLVDAQRKPRYNSKWGQKFVEFFESQRSGFGTIKFHREKITELENQIAALKEARRMHELDIDELVEHRLTQAELDQRRATSGRTKTPPDGPSA